MGGAVLAADPAVRGPHRGLSLGSRAGVASQTKVGAFRFSAFRFSTDGPVDGTSGRIPTGHVTLTIRYGVSHLPEKGTRDANRHIGPLTIVSACQAA